MKMSLLSPQTVLAYPYFQDFRIIEEMGSGNSNIVLQMKHKLRTGCEEDMVT
jgi:predicted HTH transcriptional regulator